MEHDGAGLAAAQAIPDVAERLPASELLTEPEEDDYGYPSDRTLETIRQWPWNDLNGCLDFIAKAWHWPEFGVRWELRPFEAECVHAEPSERFLRLATGGWSGNEEIIGAMRHNMMLQTRWRLSSCGGLHIYEFMSLAESQPATEVSSPTAASSALKENSQFVPSLCQEPRSGKEQREPLRATTTEPDTVADPRGDQQGELWQNYEAALDAVVQMAGHMKNAFADADRAHRNRQRWATRKLWDILSDGSDAPPPWDDLSTAAASIRQQIGSVSVIEGEASPSTRRSESAEEKMLHVFDPVRDTEAT